MSHAVAAPHGVPGVHGVPGSQGGVPMVPAAALGVPVLPPGVTIASPGARLGASLVDGILMTVTLGIGWLIWAAVTGGAGQTPGKKLMGQRVIGMTTGRPVGIGNMMLLRGFVAGTVASFAIPLSLGILLFMPFWDRRNQNLWDKISGTLVVNDPGDAWNPVLTALPAAPGSPTLGSLPPGYGGPAAR